ncbi:MAG: hypothetical protein MRY83_01190 [Flavobacteriales bacterium]|nr:hypothetical protein [Flavobacteriales bacterium]
MYKYITLLFIVISWAAKGQNVGVGTLNPTNPLHIKPLAPGTTDPLKVESIQPYLMNDTTLLVVDPSDGSIRYMPLDSLINHLDLSESDNIDSLIQTIVNNSLDSFIITQTFIDSVSSIVYNYGDTLLSNSSFVDSSYAIFLQTLLSDTAIQNLILSLQTDVDSLYLVNTTLWLHEDSVTLTADLAPIIDSSLTFVFQNIADSLLKNTSFTDSIYTISYSHLVSDTNFWAILDSTDSDIDSARLSGADLIIYEDADSITVDLASLSDSDWVQVGDTLYSFDSTVTIRNEKVGIGTINPDTTLHVLGNIKIEDGSQQQGYVLASDQFGLASWADLDTLYTPIDSTVVLNDSVYLYSSADSFFTGLANVYLDTGSVLFVSESGDNNSAIRGRPDKPWSDPWAAGANALNGDQIVILDNAIYDQDSLGYTFQNMVSRDSVSINFGSATVRLSSSIINGGYQQFSLVSEGLIEVPNTGVSLVNLTQTEGVYNLKLHDINIAGFSTPFSLNSFQRANIRINNLVSGGPATVVPAGNNDRSSDEERAVATIRFNRIQVNVNDTFSTSSYPVFGYQFRPNNQEIYIQGKSLTGYVNTAFFLLNNLRSPSNNDPYELLYHVDIDHIDVQLADHSANPSYWTSRRAIVFGECFSEADTNRSTEIKMFFNSANATVRDMGAAHVVGPSFWPRFGENILSFKGNWKFIDNPRPVFNLNANTNSPEGKIIIDGTFSSNADYPFFQSDELHNVYVRNSTITNDSAAVFDINSTNVNLNLQDVNLINDSNVAALQANTPITIKVAGAFQQNSSLEDSDVSIVKLFEYGENDLNGIYSGTDSLTQQQTHVKMDSIGNQILGMGYIPDFPNWGTDSIEHGFLLSKDDYTLTFGYDNYYNFSKDYMDIWSVNSSNRGFYLGGGPNSFYSGIRNGNSGFSGITYSNENIELETRGIGGVSSNAMFIGQIENAGAGYWTDQGLTIGKRTTSGDLRGIQFLWSNEITSDAIALYNKKYFLPNAQPSVVNTDTSIMVWAGNGLTTTPSFINKDDFIDNDWTLDGDTLYSAFDSTVVIKNGNVGIGTSEPSRTLEIAGPQFNTGIAFQEDGVPGELAIVAGFGNFNVIGASANVSHNFYSSDFLNGENELNIYSGFTAAIHFDSDDNSYITGGAVGIGTTTPVRGDLDVRGTSKVLTSGSGNLAVITTDAWAQDIGGRIVMGGAASAGDLNRTYAGIAGMKENAIDGNRAGYLQFLVRDASGGPNAGELWEPMRLTSTGYLGIGTTVPTNYLHIAADSVPLRIEGLEEDTSLDTVLTIDPNGVVYKTAVNDIVSRDDGAIIYVNDENGADNTVEQGNPFKAAKTIQAAVDSAIVWGVSNIYVFPGNYSLSNKDLDTIDLHIDCAPGVDISSFNYSGDNGKRLTIVNAEKVSVVGTQIALRNDGTVTIECDSFMADGTSSSPVLLGNGFASITSDYAQVDSPYPLCYQGESDSDFNTFNFKTKTLALNSTLIFTNAADSIFAKFEANTVLKNAGLASNWHQTLNYCKYIFDFDNIVDVSVAGIDFLYWDINAGGAQTQDVHIIFNVGFYEGNDDFCFYINDRNNPNSNSRIEVNANRWIYTGTESLIYRESADRMQTCYTEFKFNGYFISKNAPILAETNQNLSLPLTLTGKFVCEAAGVAPFEINGSSPSGKLKFVNAVVIGDATEDVVESNNATDVYIYNTYTNTATVDADVTEQVTTFIRSADVE